MNQSNDLHRVSDTENCETSFREKLQRLQSYKQSLYSTKGWSSKNVNQTSKWLVDVENIAENHHKAMGINIWEQRSKSSIVAGSPKEFNLEKLSLIHQIFHAENEDNLHMQMKTINLTSDFPEKYESQCQSSNKTSGILNNA